MMRVTHTCPQCRAPVERTVPEIPLLTCPECRITFVPDGAREAGILDRTHGATRQVAQRVPLDAAFLGRYQLSRLIGGGGMGTVYLAHDRVREAEVCLKFLFRIEDRGLMGRFLREGKLLAQIQHPHVVAVHEVGETEGHPYMAMEHVAGGTLREKLKRPRRQRDAGFDMNATADLGRRVALPPQEATRWMRQILEGLTACHERGIIHRDLKPENIFMTPDGDVKLGDLGIAKDLADLGTLITQTGAFMGTPTYVSPEQVRGQTGSPASDIYSLGVMAYEMLAGEPPFAASTLHELARMHKDELPRPLTEVSSAIPRPLAALVMSCLAKEPGERPATARELLDALDHLPRDPPRRSLRWGVVAVMAGVLAAGTMTGVMFLTPAAPIAPSPSPSNPPAIHLADPWQGDEPWRPILLPAKRTADHATWEQAHRAAFAAARKREMPVVLARLTEARKLAEGFGDLRLAQTLLELGSYHLEAGSPKAAGEPLLAARRIAAGHNTMSMRYHIEMLLGQYHGTMERPAESEVSFRAALEQAETHFGVDSAQAAMAVGNLAQSLSQQGRFDETETLLERCLARMESLDGKESFSAAMAVNGLADVYRDTGRLELAETTMRRALALFEKTEGPRGAHVPGALEGLANLHRVTGRLAEAETIYRRALDLARQVFGPRHVEVARCLQNLSSVALEQRSLDDALAHAKEALEILHGSTGPESLQVAQVLAQMGQAFELDGRTGEAMDHFRKSLELNERLMGPGDPRLARPLFYVIRLEQQTGRRKEAEAHMQRLLDLAGKAPEGSLEDAGELFGELGKMEEQAGRLDPALALFARARGLLERGDRPHPFLAVILISEGRLHTRAGRTREADEAFERAVRLWENHPPPHPPELSQAMAELAFFYMDSGQGKKAIDCLEREGRMLRKTYDPDHLLVMANEGNLAQAWMMAGQPATAIQIFERILGQKSQLERHPPDFRSHVLQGYEMALRHAGRHPEADAVRTRFEGLPSGPHDPGPR